MNIQEKVELDENILYNEYLLMSRLEGKTGVYAVIFILCDNIPTLGRVRLFVLY